MIRTHTFFNYKIGEILGKSKSEYPKIFKLLKSLEPISTLDLGCRVPNNLFMLYHIFNCKSLVGLDKMNETYCVKEHIEHLLKYTKDQSIEDKINQCSTFFDVYTVQIKPEKGEKSKLKSKENFDKIFLREFKQSDMLKYLNSDKSKFNLIILSNILHFYNKEEVDIILSKLKDKLNKEGLLLIRVQEKEIFNYKKFKESFKNIFKDGEIHEFYENNKWNNSFIINKNNFL